MAEIPIPKKGEVLFRVSRLVEREDPFWSFEFSPEWARENLEWVSPQEFVGEVADGLSPEEDHRPDLEDREWHLGRIKAIMAEPEEEWAPIKTDDEGLKNGYHRLVAAYLLRRVWIRAQAGRIDLRTQLGRWLTGRSRYQYGK